MATINFTTRQEKLRAKETSKIGKPEGFWKTYYPQRKSSNREGNRLNHKLSGKWKFYSEDGILTKLISYKNDKRNGRAESYTKEGFLSQIDHYENDFLEGESRIYFESGKEKENIPYIKGRRNGRSFELDEKGNIITITIYENDVVYSREYINRKDKSGKKQGKWKEFYSDGTVKNEGIYRDNKRDGYFKEFNKKGEVLRTEKFEDGELDKTASETQVLDFVYEKWDNGEMKSFRTYREGLLEGLSIEYDRTGKIIGSKFYKLGKILCEGFD